MFFVINTAQIELIAAQTSPPRPDAAAIVNSRVEQLKAQFHTDLGSPENFAHVLGADAAATFYSGLHNMLDGEALLPNIVGLSAFIHPWHCHLFRLRRLLS